MSDLPMLPLKSLKKIVKLVIVYYTYYESLYFSVFDDTFVTFVDLTL